MYFVVIHCGSTGLSRSPQHVKDVFCLYLLVTWIHFTDSVEYFLFFIFCAKSTVCHICYLLPLCSPSRWTTTVKSPCRCSATVWADSWLQSHGWRPEWTQTSSAAAIERPIEFSSLLETLANTDESYSVHLFVFSPSLRWQRRHVGASIWDFSGTPQLRPPRRICIRS